MNEFELNRADGMTKIPTSLVSRIALSHLENSDQSVQDSQDSQACFALTRYFGVVALMLATLLCFCSPTFAQEESEETSEPEFTQEQITYFETEIRPVLEKHCFKCHGGEAKISGGLNLTHRAGLLEGGDSGPAIDVEDPEFSVLMEAVRFESYEMPPSGMLPEETIDKLAKWVDEQAPWTPGDKGITTEGHAEMAPEVNEQTKQFWSFQPIQRPELPDVNNADWVTNEIDHFILARLEEHEMLPAAPADKLTLLRRATYDLTGLPPTQEESDAFMADDSPEAYEKVIDRLLASPHYGEKWGRHWLDLVRYAETNSYERDNPKPHVWRYRDYVIRSFNEDKPYDQFLTEQLAGDELPEPTRESLIATGYYRLGRWDDEPADPLQASYDDLDDVLTVTSQTFIGLTVNCARCHDHKIDPVPQDDYYRMLAFFDNIQRYGKRSEESVLAASVRPIASAEEQDLHKQAINEYNAKVAANKRELETIEALVKSDFIDVEHEEFKHEMNRVPLLKKRVPEVLSQEDFDKYVALTKQRTRLRRERPEEMAQALVVKEKGTEPDPTHVFIRGSAHAPGKEVTPGFPAVLSPPEPEIEAINNDEYPSSGRRLALAKWLTSDSNPLTARVMANRIWQHHFGRGIVRSSSDFGFQGTAPTHPELLDWLASELRDDHWKLKPLHKQIMLSSTYRMSAAHHPAQAAQDPTNDLFWRYDMRRLTSEEIRDSVLAVNNSLNRDKMFGPSIYTVIPQEVLAGQSRPGSGWGKSPLEDRNRRSIYIHVKRSLVEPTLEVFDSADTDLTCPVRFATTQPTQALAMLNSDFINREAVVLAKFLQDKHPDNLEKQVELALSRVMQHQPSKEDVATGIELIQSLKESEDLSDEQALKCFCVVAYNINEFLYLD